MVLLELVSSFVYALHALELWLNEFQRLALQRILRGMIYKNYFD